MVKEYKDNDYKKKSARKARLVGLLFLTASLASLAYAGQEADQFMSADAVTLVSAERQQPVTAVDKLRNELLETPAHTNCF